MQSSLSTRVLHGDVLRCVLQFIESHRELFRLHQTTKLLAEIREKVSMWPFQMRKGRLTSQQGLIGLIQLPQIAQTLTELDITSMPFLDYELQGFDVMTTQLRAFTSLHSFAFNRRGAGNSHIGVRDAHESCIGKFLQGSSVMKLRIALDLPTSDFHHILPQVPYLQVLQLDLYSDRTSTHALLRHYHTDVTPSSCPRLKKLIVNFDTTCISPVTLTTQGEEHVLHQFRAALVNKWIPALTSMEQHQQANDPVAFAAAMEIRRVTTPPCPEVNFRTQLLATAFAPASSLTLLQSIETRWRDIHITTIKFDLVDSRTKASQSTTTMIREYSQCFDRICDLQLYEPPKLWLQLSCSLEKEQPMMVGKTKGGRGRPAPKSSTAATTTTVTSSVPPLLWYPEMESSDIFSLEYISPLIARASTIEVSYTFVQAAATNIFSSSSSSSIRQPMTFADILSYFPHPRLRSIYTMARFPTKDAEADERVSLEAAKYVKTALPAQSTSRVRVFARRKH